jgi:hypothetical protein
MNRQSTLFAVSASLVAAALPLSTAFAGKGKRARGTGIAVQNLRGESVQVHVDGELMGLLPPEGRAKFPAGEGARILELQDADGETILRRTVQVERGERSRVRLRGGDGELLLVNDSGVDQVVYVTDREGRVRHQTIEDGSSMDLPVTPGEVSLRTSRTWFGVRVNLDERDLMVAPGASKTVQLSEVEEALVQIENRSEGAISLFLGDERLGIVGAESVGFVRAPVGEIELEGRFNGMEAFERTITVDDEQGARMTVEVHMGSVTAINESFAPARVIVDGKSHGWMRPGESREFEVPAGSRTVAFIGQGGVMKENEVRVRALQSHRLVLRPDQMRRSRER